MQNRINTEMCGYIVEYYRYIPYGRKKNNMKMAKGENGEFNCL